MNPALQLPLVAVEWACHAATTIKDAEGKVVAECTGNGQHSDDAVPAAAEIVRRVNAYDQLVQVIEHLVRWHDQLTPADIMRAKAVLEQVTGSASHG